MTAFRNFSAILDIAPTDNFPFPDFTYRDKMKLLPVLSQTLPYDLLRPFGIRIFVCTARGPPRLRVGMKYDIALETVLLHYSF